MVSNKGIYSSRSFWPLLGAITVATRETKAGPVSAYAHRGPTFDLASLTTSNRGNIGSRCQSRARALNVSAKVLCVGEGYFFFFLPVFFFAFFAFLAMLPSAIPKLVQCKSTSTCISTEYTTITKLILRASKKVNGDHTTARCEWTTSLTMLRRDMSTRLVVQPETSVPKLTWSRAARASSLELHQFCSEL